MQPVIQSLKIKKDETYISIHNFGRCGSSHARVRLSHNTDPVVAENVEVQNTQLAEALNTGDLRHASEMADSMSLFVDDLTPEQTVQVLMAFLSVHNEAVAKGDRRLDLETLRKYVDVYDIAVNANPKDTRAAFAKANKINPDVDFDAVAKSFREKLSQYDAIQDGSLVAPEPSESEAADTVKEEIPLDLRPAE